MYTFQNLKQYPNSDQSRSALSIKWKQNHNSAQPLPFAKYSHVPYIIWSSFQPYDLSKRKDYDFHFTAKETEAERSCDLPKVIQLVSSRARTSAKAIPTPRLLGSFLYYGILAISMPASLWIGGILSLFHIWLFSRFPNSSDCSQGNTWSTKLHSQARRTLEGHCQPRRWQW